MTAANKQETRDELLAELDKPNAEAWIPKKAGDTLVGYLKDIRTGTTQYGAAPFLVVVDEQGVEHSVWVFFESLRSALKSQQPQRGERIAIRYNGEKPAKNPTQGRNKSYHDYQIAVDRPVSASAAIDWNSTLSDWNSTLRDTVQTGDVEPSTEDIPF